MSKVSTLIFAGAALLAGCATQKQKATLSPQTIATAAEQGLTPEQINQARNALAVLVNHIETAKQISANQQPASGIVGSVVAYYAVLPDGKKPENRAVVTLNNIAHEAGLIASGQEIQILFNDDKFATGITAFDKIAAELQQALPQSVGISANANEQLLSARETVLAKALMIDLQQKVQIMMAPFIKDAVKNHITSPTGSLSFKQDEAAPAAQNGNSDMSQVQQAVNKLALFASEKGLVARKEDLIIYFSGDEVSTNVPQLNEILNTMSFRAR